MLNPRCRLLAVVVLVLAASDCVGLFGTQLPAGDLTTKTGFVISGRPVEVEGLSIKAARQNRGPVNIKHLWMVDDGMRRTFVPQRMVSDEAVNTENLITVDEFELRRPKTTRAIGPSIVGSYVEKTPFDDSGHRRVSLHGGKLGLIHVIQEITKLRPDIIAVNSTTHRWTYAMSTRVLEDQLLLSLLERASEPSNPIDRLRIVKFLVDAERYTLAQQQLAAFRVEFPEMQARADQMQEQLNFYIARQALMEIQQRKRAGQERFAYAYAQKFPTDRVSADVQREARELIAGFRSQQQQIDTAKMLLGEFQAELNPEQAEEVGPIRSIVCDELSFATIDRLEPFLRSELDDTLSAGEKLALAYSGWLLGDAKAETSLPYALRMWRARFLMLEVLRAERDVDRQAALRELSSIDGATVETMAEMVPRSPMPVETGPLTAGVPATVELPAEDGSPSLRYSFVVPPEYTPGRAYPVLIALRSQGMTTEQILQWWAGTSSQPGIAQDRGYIVVAPEYADADAPAYDYSGAAGQVVRATLNDVRQRLNVDSDRIYLTGHGMGGDAAFDVGMSHPDLFAGVLPVVGVCAQHCKVYWKNCPDLAWYVVGGEKDRDTLDANAMVLNKMVVRGYDVTYVEYIERGFETYFEERPRMFDWMELHRRAPQRKEFELDLLRPEDAQRDWVKAENFREDVLQPVAWVGGRLQTRPQHLIADINLGGTVTVRSGAQQTTIKLSPSLVDLNERIRVRIGTRQVYNDFVKPDLEALLNDLRERGDRQRLYWAQLVF